MNCGTLAGDSWASNLLVTVSRGSRSRGRAGVVACNSEFDNAGGRLAGPISHSEAADWFIHSVGAAVLI